MFSFIKTLMLYKYLNNILRTFVKFLDQLIYAHLRPAPSRIFTFAQPQPAPQIFILALARPAGKSSAPPIPGIYQ